MSISFNNIPNTVRTPGTYTEIDNSRALQGLAQNPHKVLIIGQKVSEGTVGFDTLIAITKDNLADGYFGSGSILARMCNVFKDNNPNTELFAMAIGSGVAGTAASTALDISTALVSDEISGAETMHMMFNGTDFDFALTSGMSGGQIASVIASTINAISTLPMVASMSGVNAASMGHIVFKAVCSGTAGNYLNVRHNYNVGESFPTIFSTDPSTMTFAAGATDPDLAEVWTVIDDNRFNYIVQPYVEAANLIEIEDELLDRFGPMVDLQGHGFVGAGKTTTTAATLGNARNSKHNTILAADDSPSDPVEWGAALAAQAAFNLNNDPARPLSFLKLKGILPPPPEKRFTRAERDALLYDGIATFIVDKGGNVLIERCITTYQTNALGDLDASYLDIQTVATLGEIRDQYRIRMSNRFLVPRFKLADDGFPTQPGQFIATPKLVKAEIVDLFTQLRDVGLIENLSEFTQNLIVERSLSDRNRVDVLLPPDLINQFRILATVIQFIL